MTGSSLSMRRLRLKIENVMLNVDLENGFFGLLNQSAEPHNHMYFEFHGTVSGVMKLWSEKGEYYIKKDETAVIAPNVLHYLTPCDDKSLRSSFCFSFSRIKGKSDIDLYEYFRSAFSGIDGVLKIPPSSELSLLLNKVLSLIYSENEPDRVRIKTYFLLLLTGIAEAAVPSGRHTVSEAESPLNESDVRHYVAEEYFRRNYQSDIRLSDLADIWHLSLKQTERVFAAEFGQTFTEYLINLRMTYAKILLEETGLSVGEIAERVGYGSYNGFYVTFTAYTGMTPTEYRKNSGAQQI